MVLPLLTTLVYAFANNDASETPQAARPVWERFLERAWAVIVIDFLGTYLTSVGLAGTMSNDVAAAIVGIVATIVAILIVFADVAATVDDDPAVWSLLPRSISKSARAVTRPKVLARAVALYALGLLVFAVQESIVLLLTNAHAANVEFWSEVPLQTVATVPLAALTLVVYRDAAITAGLDRAKRN